MPGPSENAAAGGPVVLTQDERIWTIGIDNPLIRAQIAVKTRLLEDASEWLPGASIGPVGDGPYYLSATCYLPGRTRQLRLLFHVTEAGCRWLESWDALDRLRAAATAGPSDD